MIKDGPSMKNNHNKNESSIRPTTFWKLWTRQLISLFTIYKIQHFDSKDRRWNKERRINELNNVLVILSKGKSYNQIYFEANEPQ